MVTANTTQNPEEIVLQAAAGFLMPRCLHAVANLGVADALGDTPQSADALANTTGANAGTLARAIRLLAAYGIFAYRDGLVAHTAASRLLRDDHPQSLRPLARMFGSRGVWEAVGELEHAIRTGEPSAEKALPNGGLWGYLASHPDQSRIFGEAMGAKARGQVSGVVASYDFSGASTIADIGGGHGHLLQAVLAAAPHARGILFDQPHVVTEAAAVASDRLRLQGGDFLKDPLPSADLYLMMEVIHDWDDEAAARILQAVRRVAPAHARLLLIESILPDDPGPNWPKTLDAVMLTIGGRQRTQAEYGDLLGRCGFAMTREIDTRAGVSIIESARA